MSDAETTPPIEDPEQPDELIGQVLDRRYRIVERIGEGGIGAVYSAEHVQLRRKVAVKILHAEHAQNTEFRMRFEREGLAASKATHPSCVAVLDLGAAEGDRPYIVMEYVEGKLLTDRLAEGSMMSAEAVEIALQILEALKHAHQHNIVHRDVKPDNVMLCSLEKSGTQVKLLDFGLAKNLVPGAPGSNNVTQWGTVCGTPSYMSPEQGVGQEADTRSDLYSTGVLLFLMVCGRKPFTNTDPLEQIRAHLTEPPPKARELNPGVSQQLEAVIDRALVKERNERFQTAEQFIQALKRVPEITGELDEPVPVMTGVAVADTLHATDLLVDGTLPNRSVAPVEPEEKKLSRGMFIALLTAEGVGAAALLTVALIFYPDPTAQFSGAVQKQIGFKPDVLKRSPPDLLKAFDLYARGKLASAEKHARRAVFRVKKNDGRAHLLLGHIYYKKIWLTDAIKQYGKALARDPNQRDNPVMLQNVIGSMRRSKVAPKARYLLVHRVGKAAIPALKAASSHKDLGVRRNAARALKMLKP